MTIRRQDVQHVARLARLRLGEAELARLENDLRRILSHVESLDGLDLTGVEPTSHLAADRLPLRPDVARDGLSQDSALSEAPRTAAGAFAVPAFVDDP